MTLYIYVTATYFQTKVIEDDIKSKKKKTKKKDLNDDSSVLDWNDLTSVNEGNDDDSDVSLFGEGDEEEKEEEKEDDENTTLKEILENRKDKRKNNNIPKTKQVKSNTESNTLPKNNKKLKSSACNIEPPPDPSDKEVILFYPMEESARVYFYAFFI